MNPKPGFGSIAAFLVIFQTCKSGFEKDLIQHRTLIEGDASFGDCILEKKILFADFGVLKVVGHPTTLAIRRLYKHVQFDIIKSC